MQLEMFTDPLREKALEVIERALKGSDVDKVFASYYGGTRTGFSFQFDPKTKYFYYSDKFFSTYQPEPWVRKISKEEIRRMFG